MSTVFSDDPWTTELKGYSEDNLYLRSTDRRGHHEDMRAHFPPYVANQLRAVYKELGYPTVAAFLRDAVVHRLKYWSDHAPDSKRIQYLLAGTIIEGIREDITYATELVRRFKIEMQEAKFSPALCRILAEQFYDAWEGLPPYLDDVSMQFSELAEDFDLARFCRCGGKHTKHHTLRAIDNEQP